MSTTFTISPETSDDLTTQGFDRRKFVKSAGIGVAALSVLSATSATAFAARSQTASNLPAGADNFYTSDKVIVRKVTFNNQSSMQVTGNLVAHNNLNRNGRAPAIIGGHPKGAVKEQRSMLYSQKLAEQSFVTLATDLALGV